MNEYFISTGISSSYFIVLDFLFSLSIFTAPDTNLYLTYI